MATAGQIAGRKATKEELEDAEYGFSICKVLAPLSFGQTVIVNKRSVVAVEAIFEGTDATLPRAGLCKGWALLPKMIVLTKMSVMIFPQLGPALLSTWRRLISIALPFTLSGR